MFMYVLEYICNKFNDKEIALMCASHQGEKLHTDTARSMLKKLDLTIEDYECGSHEPVDKNTRNNLIRAKKTASQ